MACYCIRACNDDTEKEITINVTHQNMNFREPKFDAEFVMTTFEYVDRTNLIV